MYNWFLLIWLHLWLASGQTDINMQQQRNASPDMHPSYIIIASKTIRPGTIYQVVVNILHMERPVHVRASISRAGVQIAKAKKLMKTSESNKLLLKIPQTTIPGNYLLQVSGNVNDGIGGNLFQYTKELSFSSKFLTILIQSNRAVYNADQTIRFRTVIMTTEMKPYADPIDINILNPKGYVMKNYGSVYLNVGVGSFTYKLPFDSNRGWWTIQVVAQSQIEEKRIYVEKYYYQRTEVYIQIPETVMDTDDAITGTMHGWYLNNAPVLGNATVRVYVTPPTHFYKQAESLHALQEYVHEFEGNYELNIKLADLERLVSPLAGSIVTIEGSLTDQRLDLLCVGYSKTRIITGNVEMKFLGSQPKFFKSGMPFKTYLVISYADEAPLSKSKLQDSSLHISRIITHGNGGTIRLVEIHDRFPDDGLYKLEFVVPENTIRMSIKAVYKDNEEMATADLLSFPYYSLDTRSIFVYTSTKEAYIGEYLVIHVVSKGIIIHSAVEDVDPLRMPIKTTAIPISSEMAPTCNIVVYHVTRDGIVISDSMRVPVTPLKKEKFTFELNNRKDKTGNTIEYCILTEPGDQIAVSAHDLDTSCINCGQEITKAAVLQSLHSFDEDNWRTSKILRASRDYKPDQLFFYDSSGFGNDDKDTFTQTGLEVFTDAIIASSSLVCSNDTSYISCQDGSCFLATKICDGEFDCRNGFDESNCSSSASEKFDIYEFRITRFSHFDQFFDMSDGDWAWFDYNSNGFDAFNQLVPNRGSKWVVYAFHSNKDTGFSILQDPLVYDGTKQFCISVEMPTLCRRGEQIGIRVELFNFGKTELFITVVLMASDSYRFVHVEGEGQVRSYDARTSGGEHHHLVWVKPESSLPVFVPVVPIVLGEVQVIIEAWTHVAMDRAETTITVEPEGITQFLHTSMMLDLKNQPLTLKFIDVNVTETPIVPYERWRKYIFGTPIARISIVGDVFGPVFPEMPMNAYTALRKPDRTGEMQLFNFGINLYTVHYLRLTNQMTSDVYSEAFDQLTYYYAFVMAYQHNDGSFTMFRDNVGSVWLTALVLRTFHQARFPDWENDIYIDPQIFIDGITWLIDFQTADGSFIDTTPFPYDKKTRSDPIWDSLHHLRYRNISLTAQVLLTLTESIDLPGDLKTRVSNAKLLATQYLERQLNDLKNPYEIALTAFTLTKVNSVDKELAFDMLDKIKIEQEDHVYWAVEAEDPIVVIQENQRPYIQPRFPRKYDSINVETTAYALLVYCIKEESFHQENIVKWLNTMRSMDGGFVSTQDTLVAMQALIEYTFRTRIREVTNMNVQLEISSMAATEYLAHVNQETLSKLQSFPIENVWGFVTITAHGSGFAIAQLDVQYGVDRQFLIIEPPIPAFELNVGISFAGKNASVINVRSCQRWTLTQESPVSGLAVLEIQTPTGYWIQYHDLRGQVLYGGVRHIRRAKINNRNVVLYFEHLSSTWTCLEFKLNRYFPVANMTQYMKARIYEYYSPERYNQTLIDSYNLYVLSICHVCGSYQCPFCPFFSSSVIFNIDIILFVICIVLDLKFLNIF